VSTFSEKFGFSENPFEKYVAESEPNIASYAVTPPYFTETKKHTDSVSSFILFGFRGSGKSATRLTNEKEIWKEIDAGRSKPLIVNLTDFEPLISKVSPDKITLNQIIAQVAFLTIERILLWMSDQEEKEELFDLLTEEEQSRFVKLVKTFYLDVPELARKVSLKRTMILLNQTWINKSAYWIEKRWEPISTIASKITSAAGQKYLEIGSTADELKQVLQKDEQIAAGIVALDELVSCARGFGFDGVCVYIDKVDEHPKTQNSSETAAKVIFPILAQVQMMEIEGFAWVFFLWDNIKDDFSADKLKVRLDKFAYSEISWETNFLKTMVENRVQHFSKNDVKDGQEFCAADVDFSKKLEFLIELVQKSPRELMRLLDVIIREYDALNGTSTEPKPLTEKDFERGIDSYIRNVVWTLYDRKTLSEILRLGKDEFINKDVQSVFRISDQGARNRIVNWTNSGAVRKAGTTAAEGVVGGKPANFYRISDPRISLMLEKQLFEVDTLTAEAPILDQAPTDERITE